MNQQMIQQYLYRAEVKRIVDGDTLDVELSVGFGILVKQRLRLADVNTPEIYSVKKDSEEYKEGIKAKEFVEKLLTPSGPSFEVMIETFKDKKGKYGRYIATVYYRNNQDEQWLSLNEQLINKGYF